MKCLSFALCTALLMLTWGCSSENDGPTPSPAEVAPSTICTAQGDNTLSITGTGFSPLVVDGLTSDPSVVMPTLVFVAPDQVETEIPAGGVSLPDRTGTALEALVPAELLGPLDPAADPVSYDLQVINANGNDGFLAGALTVVPPPDLTGVQPATGAADTVVSVTLSGLGFRDGMSVTLDADPAVPGDNVVIAGPDAATADFDLSGVAAGTYSITVTNSEGCSSTLPDAFTVYEPNRFDLTGIDPPFGCTCEDTTVTISSDGGFVSTPTVEMRPAGQSAPVIAFERVAFIDGDTITAVVPAGAELGDYDVTVTNPPSDGGIGTLEAGFRVVEFPIPTIEALSPSRGDPAADTLVTVFGENFRDTVTLELLDDALAVVATIPDITPTTPNELQATFPTNGLAEGIYLVRITNNDEATFSTFSNFLVAAVGASGNLHPFANQSSMTTGRRSLAGVQARDDDGNFYLYAMGGDTGDGGAVLDSVEVTQLSKFGELATWTEQRNALVTPRVGAAAVSVPIFDASPFVPAKSYIYVFGGQDDGGAILSTIERAVVLSADDAPDLEAVAGAAAGSLDAGTWYYKVAAVLDVGDPDNPGGETLSSDEAIVTIGATGSVDLSWDEVTVNGTAAASYRIYRTAAVNGASQTELLIDTVTGTSYQDTGAVAGSEAPLPSGSTGVWVELGETMTVARWGHSAALVADANGDRSIAIVGGKDNQTDGYLATLEFAAVSDLDGSIVAPSAANTNDLPAGRAFFSLGVETTATVSGFGAGTRLWVVGGVSAGAAVFDVVSTDVAVGGGNAAFDAPIINGQTGPLAGPMCVITGDKLFVVGGGATADDTSVSSVTDGARDMPFDGVGDVDPPMQSAANALIGGARALGVSVVGSGFIYFIGGSSDGTDALATTEKTF